MRQILRSRWMLMSGGAAALVAAILFTWPGGTPPAVQAAPFFTGHEQTTVETTTYVVQPGDNLLTIAARFNTTVAVLMELNNLTNPNLIRIGQELIVPAPGSGTTLLPPATNTPVPTPVVTATATATATPTAAAPPTATPTTLPTGEISPTVREVWGDSGDEIELISPVEGALYHSPIEVIGYSRTFEGNVIVRLTNSAGDVIAQRNATGGSVDGFDFFHTAIRFFAQEEDTATLEVFEIDAATGEEINTVSVEITLLPGQRFIDVDSPTVGAAVCSPIAIAGYSNTFEANVSIELNERDGTTLTTTNATGGNLGIYDDFFTAPIFEVEEPQPLLVSVYEQDAAGRGAIDLTRIPVAVYPDDNLLCQ